jgi:hypothetical protein
MSRHIRRVAMLVAALVFAAAPAAAVAAPLLVGPPIIPPPSTTASVAASPCSEVCSGGGYTAGSQSLRSRPATAAAPSTTQCGAVCSNAGYGTRQQFLHEGSPTTTGPAHVRGLPSSHVNTTDLPSSNVRVVVHDSGFDWGDAGIGAGTVFALGLIGLGGAFAVTRRRGGQHRTA